MTTTLDVTNTARLNVIMGQGMPWVSDPMWFENDVGGAQISLLGFTAIGFVTASTGAVVAQLTVTFDDDDEYTFRFGQTQEQADDVVATGRGLNATMYDFSVVLLDADGVPQFAVAGTMQALPKMPTAAP